MSFASASQPPPGKRSGKQNRSRFGLRGSTKASKARALDGARRLALQSVVQAENGGLADLAMPTAAQSPLLYAFCCFPPASPALAPGAGKQKTAPKDRSKHLIFLRKTGAGEGIRTLDPNLVKILLLPATIDIARFSDARNTVIRALFRHLRGHWLRIAGAVASVENNRGTWAQAVISGKALVAAPPAS